MKPISSDSLDEYYDAYPRLEEAFGTALDKSLNPRGPEMLYEIVENLQLPSEAQILDLGCAEGEHTFKLAKRFDSNVKGVDAIERHIQEANAEAGKLDSNLRDRIRFEVGTADEIPASDNSIDLLWCRDVLVHLANLHASFAEWQRVLRRGGHVLVLHSYGTTRLEPREATWLWATMRVVPENTDPSYVEAAFHKAGLKTRASIELSSEWKEFSVEHGQPTAQHLLHAARLLRAPDRYVAEFGQAAYEIKLGDALWHIYQMIGKLSYRIYLLQGPQ